MGSEEEDDYFLTKGAFGRIRVLFFLNKVNDWVTKAMIFRATGEEWGRLTEYINQLCKLGSIDADDKRKTLGHFVYKINPKGVNTVIKLKSETYKEVRELLRGTKDPSKQS